MGEAFDPYREALVVEEKTVWPEELAELANEEKARVEKALHADAATTTELDYVRLHAGFCRTITVAQADVDRIGTS